MYIDNGARLLSLGALVISVTTLLVVLWDRKPARKRDVEENV